MTWSRTARALSTIVLLLALALLAGRARPAQAVVGSAADPSIETNSTVFAMAPSPAGLFIAGSFSRAGIPTGHGTDLGQVDGTPNLAFARANNVITAVVSDGAGGWYVGGNFTLLGSVARNGIGHLLADGTVDPRFDPNIANPALNNVNALVLSGSTLYAGGNFTTVNGFTTRNHLAAFDAGTGVATSFDPSINGSGTSVAALAISGSTLYAAGAFTSVGSPAVTRDRLAAFDTATGLPTSFDPNIDPTNANAAVSALALSASTLYAGGTFTKVNGVTTRDNLAAFDTATATATGFDADVNDAVAALAVAGGTVYAGGAFTTANAGVVTRRDLAGFDASTGAVTAFDPNVANNNVSALALSGGTLYVGGGFTSVQGGALVRNRMAAFSIADGSVVAGFDPNLDGSVVAIAAGGSRVYAGGAFSFAGAGTIHNRIAEIKPDGTLDATFDPGIPAGNVNALVLSGTTLYAGGSFVKVNGTLVRNSLAAFDTTTGVADPAFNPNLNAAVNALALSGSTLYAGGSFTTVNATTARSRLAAFDTGSGTATSFNPIVNNTVLSLLLSASTLYAGGSFTTVNTSTARGRVVALDTATGTASAFNANANGNVNALLLSAGTLYLGGAFTSVNGTVARGRLAAVDSATGTATAFNPNVSGLVSSLALSGPTLYVGGTYTSVNASVPRNSLAAVDATAGAADLAFNPSLGNGTGSVNALALSGSQLYAGGNYPTVGPNQHLDFARFSTPVAPAATTGAASSIADVSASVAGTVDPNGFATTYTFEYGPTLTFGSITTVGSAGAGGSAVPEAATLAGLTTNTTYYYRLVATSSAGSTFGTVRSFRTTGIGQPPVALTGAPSSVTSAGATLAGQVDPEGEQTAYTFEYGVSTSFGSITAVVALDDADALEPVSATLAGLAPDTTYYYRTVATNQTGTTFGAVAVFSTGPGGAPVVSTGAASAITTTTATLSGTVDAHGLPTAYTFEYGTTTSFGSISAIDDAGSSDGANGFSLPVSGLAPGTTYLFRIVATNAAGTTSGTVRSFTTAGV